MKKILVTGGSGFIGSHLVEKLLQGGNYVINLDNFHSYYPYSTKIKNTLQSLSLPPNLQLSDNKERDLQQLQNLVKNNQYELVIGDIRNKELLKNLFKNNTIDTVVHLAALAGVRPSLENASEYMDVNINGTVNILEAAKDAQVKNLVVASSSSVYGNNEKIPFSETDVVDFPISPYAASKRSTEVLGHTYHHLYEMSLVFLRFFTVYGPRQRPDLAIHKFTRLITNNQPIPFYGTGDTSRDYTYIDDIVSGILQAIDFVNTNTKRFEVVNLGENETVSLNRMLNTIEELTGKKAIKNQLPLPPGDVLRTYADIDKSQQLFNYYPHTPFEEGMRKFIQWFNEQDA